MTRTTENSLIERRARILAMVQFTSRHDLQVSDLLEDSGLDLLVRIIADGPDYQKIFGVQLKGTSSALPDAERATRHLGKSKREGKLSPKYSFPVIVLLFSMEDDKGYFAWSIEPILDRSGQPKLKLHDRLTFAPFDRSTLETIVSRVNEWQNSLVALLETA